MLLITQQEVIDAAFLEREQISPNSIRPLRIEIAEEKYIRPRFGDVLFEEFATGYHADFVNQYIKPALAHFVRSAIIDELSMQVGDNGVVIFGSSASGESTGSKSENADKTCTTVTTDTLTQSEATTAQKVVEEDHGSLIVDDTTSGPSVTTPANTEIIAVLDERGDRSSTESDTTTVTTNITDTVNDQEVAEESLTSSNSTSQQSQTMRGADYLERRILISRALSDAITLTSRAVRFVEKNLDKFPSYVPQNNTKRRFF